MKTYKIKSLAHVICDFLQTEEGKKVLLDYIISIDAIDYKLLEEIKEYANKK